MDIVTLKDSENEGKPWILLNVNGGKYSCEWEKIRSQFNKFDVSREVVHLQIQALFIQGCADDAPNIQDDKDNTLLNDCEPFCISNL